MSEVLKVNACVYSRKGNEREINRDDFYMNGVFLSEHHLENMQASIENRASEFFFAVSDHMDYSDDDTRTNLSILREIGRFHERITVHEGDIDFKTKELSSRVTETAKYLESFLDMNRVPADDPSRQMGFSGLLLTDGKAFGATYGTGHIFYCRGNVFKHITAERAKPTTRLVELGVESDGDTIFKEKYSLSEDDKTEPVLITEPIDVMEGDKFLLISDGVYNALGEERIEDILSMRSDSAYIAYRTISEAMKHGDDDMTAMVIRIERVTASSATIVKKTAERPRASSMKSTAAPPYKYKKKGYKKYENVIFYAATVCTAILLILIMYLVIKNIMGKLRGTEDVSPTPIAIATLSPTPTPPEEAQDVTPEPTPEPTQAPVEIKTHVVQKGETLSGIARQYYGDNWTYVEKLGMYNKIPAPYDNISVGQVLKIPSKEELLAAE